MINLASCMDETMYMIEHVNEGLVLEFTADMEDSCEINSLQNP